MSTLFKTAAMAGQTLIVRAPTGPVLAMRTSANLYLANPVLNFPLFVPTHGLNQIRSITKSPVFYNVAQDQNVDAPEKDNDKCSTRCGTEDDPMDVDDDDDDAAAAADAADAADKNTKELIDKILRVDHAGEFGADRIYAGQMSILGNSDVGHLIQEMWDQEKEHVAKFEELLPKYRVRPTALIPLWDAAGYVLGFGTALMGKEAAMACTVAVEKTISAHYSDQLRQLLEDASNYPEDPEKHRELLDTIKKFRDDEIEHHDIGLANDAELAPAYQLMSFVIENGCKVAIKLSEKI